MAAMLALLLPLFGAVGSVGQALQDGAQGCPVRLLDIEPLPQEGEGEEATSSRGATSDDKANVAPRPAERLALVDSGLEYLGSLRSPLYVVPALGVFRGGKSLLLNRLMGLRAPYPGGFGVGHAQQTFTRGVHVCGEEVEGLGTVVWMDTEGLFSPEDAHSEYGPKIFSLALLFSSAVLINSVKVLNEQFFAFFAEQQQIARVLRQGLSAEGLRDEALLPRNLSVHWVLQQPVRYSGWMGLPSLDQDSAASQQLEAFLGVADETRARVRRDFVHSIHEVPQATHDVRQWGRLDSLPDEELLPEYRNATGTLRASLLSVLSKSRPWQAGGVAKQFKMYVELVRTERFSGALVKEAFEEAEISALCEAFGTAVATAAGSLPNTSLADAIAEARLAIQHRQAAVQEDFHFSAAWRARLERCYQDRTAELERQNSEQVLLLWQAEAAQVAEEGSCFFLGKLSGLLREYMDTYGAAFSRSVQVRAVDYASALQRTRLVECVRLRDFLWPLVPWVAWPVCSFYLRGGALSGLVSMALHAVVLVGVYAVLQLLHQLPGFLDVEYPVLRKHPVLLALAMRAPPMVPWGAFGKIMGSIGAARSCWKFLKCLFEMGKPAGHAHTVSQLVNLELKVNAALRRTELAVKQELVACAMDAADSLERFELRAASRALMRGLCIVRDKPDDRIFNAAVDASLMQQVVQSLRQFRMPLPGPAPSLSSGGGGGAGATAGAVAPRGRSTSATAAERLVLDGGGLAELVARDDITALVSRMVQLLGALPTLACPASQGGPQASHSQQPRRSAVARAGSREQQQQQWRQTPDAPPSSRPGLSSGRGAEDTIAEVETSKSMASDSSEPDSGPTESADEVDGAGGEDKLDIFSGKMDKSDAHGSQGGEAEEVEAEPGPSEDDGGQGEGVDATAGDGAHRRRFAAVAAAGALVAYLSAS